MSSMSFAISMGAIYDMPTGVSIRRRGAWIILAHDYAADRTAAAFFDGLLPERGTPPPGNKKAGPRWGRPSLPFYR